jgi:NitT/TauT family transport system ATP-binding protein
MTFLSPPTIIICAFWMAGGGVDPDEDVRLVVLPPPLHGESLANRHVDAFCVGAPWNSVAVDLGIGFILLFRLRNPAACGREGAGRSKACKAREHPDVLARLVRAARARR